LSQVVGASQPEAVYSNLHLQMSTWRDSLRSGTVSRL
jgi:hypothetical protein